MYIYIYIYREREREESRRTRTAKLFQANVVFGRASRGLDHVAIQGIQISNYRRICRNKTTRQGKPATKPTMYSPSHPR